MTLTLKIAKNVYPAWHSGSLCCIIIRNLVTKCPVIPKILSGQAYTDILNLRCDLDLEHNHSFFPPHDTLAYDTILSNQVWLQTDQQFRRYNILWLYKLSLWPWHWTQWTNSSVWHFGLWCCKAIPGLVTKCYVVQKILFEQTFTNNLNLRCDLDLKRSNPISSTGRSGVWCCPNKPSLVANGPAV